MLNLISALNPFSKNQINKDNKNYIPVNYQTPGKTLANNLESVKPLNRPMSININIIEQIDNEKLYNFIKTLPDHQYYRISYIDYIEYHKQLKGLGIFIYPGNKIMKTIYNSGKTTIIVKTGFCIKNFKIVELLDNNNGFYENDKPCVLLFH